MYAITNGRIILPHQTLENYAVIIDGHFIHAILPEGEVGHMEKIDANQGYIVPGFVDIHSDYIENVVSPRPSCLMDFELGIRETERLLMTHGITTIFHSLSFYKEDEITHKAIRQPEKVYELVQKIQQMRTAEHLIRNRVHARFEIDNIEQVDALIEQIEKDSIHLLSFMDHSPGQGQYRDLEVYRQMIKSYKKMSDEEADSVILTHENKAKITLDEIKSVSQLAIQKNIAVASHDDDSIEKLKTVASFGTTISEFPTSLEVAKEAKKLGLITLAGAPNVLLGGSHSGNLCARTAIQEGVIDVLCSDYYPPSLLHAIFALEEELEKPLHELIQMVTLAPAKAVHLEHQIGSIEKGKHADLLIIEKKEDEYPVVTKVVVNGKLTMEMNYR